MRTVRGGLTENHNPACWFTTGRDVTRCESLLEEQRVVSTSDTPALKRQDSKCLNLKPNGACTQGNQQAWRTEKLSLKGLHTLITLGPNTEAAVWKVPGVSWMLSREGSTGRSHCSLNTFLPPCWCGHTYTRKLNLPCWITKSGMNEWLPRLVDATVKVTISSTSTSPSSCLAEALDNPLH